jgi:hypothetical protein
MQGTNPAPLKAHPLSGCAKEPFRRRRAPNGTGFLALAFHTLLSFQGTSPGCSSATHLRFPCPVTAGAAGRYHGPFKIVKDFPPARRAYSWWSTTRHVDTFTQKRRPAPQPSGRQDGHRTAVGSNPLGVRRPPVFRCRRHWRRPERSSVSKNFPACSLEKVAPRWTACQPGSAGWTPTTTTVPAVSPVPTAGAGPAFPRGSGPRGLQADRGAPADGEQPPVQLGRRPALLDRADLLTVEADRALADQPPGLAP